MLRLTGVNNWSRRGLVLAPACFAALVFGLSFVASASGAAAAPTVKVWFLKGEQLSLVNRAGSSGADAIRALLAGPTAAERRAGVRTYVPAQTKLRSVTVADGVATVDLTLPFVLGADGSSLLARLSQVVRTASGPEGTTKVRLLIEGGTPLGMFPGAFVAGPITVAYLEKPNVPVSKPPAPKPLPVVNQVKEKQQKLASLGYLFSNQVDGKNGPATHSAVLAFQKWEGLARDGQIGPQTLRRLQAAKRPTPRTHGPSGKRAEVLIDRQVALAIYDNRVVRVIHVSTGKRSTPTPPGKGSMRPSSSPI